jgi:signal transduction histidine kinase
LAVARLNSRAEDDRWHMRKDGARFWATGTVNAIRDSEGCVTGFLKIIRDRTEQRSQIETLEQSNAALRESRERVHLFLSTLGHELRNPLGPLSGAVQVIRKLNADPRVESALQIVSRQVAALTRLADDLMDVARLEAGKVELKLQTVDLRSLVSDAVRSMERAAADQQLTLQAVLPDGALRAQIDESRFHRLVLNLLGNAIKYTPPGGRVWVKATQEGGDVVLRVEDNGIGITPGMLPKIFELFTQDHNARSMSPSGLGVGLAMVREIAELHGGSVQARSAGTGKGAEFTVRLPGAPA